MSWNDLKDWWRSNIVEEWHDPTIGTATLVNPPMVRAVSREPVLFDQIKTSLKREDAPKFSRSYSAYLTPYVSCEIVAKYGYFGRSREFGGMLREQGGEWVVFDPGNIARKIIDHALVPLVAEFVKAVSVMDDQFVRTQTDRFTDDRGQTWITDRRRLSL